jgi:hypothetical protein
MEKLHYTAKLKNEIAEKDAKIEIINQELTDLMIYLASDKFAGVTNNYVNAQEMFEWLRNLRSKL